MINDSNIFAFYILHFMEEVPKNKATKQQVNIFFAHSEILIRCFSELIMKHNCHPDTVQRAANTHSLYLHLMKH